MHYYHSTLAYLRDNLECYQFPINYLYVYGTPKRLDEPGEKDFGFLFKCSKVPMLDKLIVIEERKEDDEMDDDTEEDLEEDLEEDSDGDDSNDWIIKEEEQCMVTKQTNENEMRQDNDAEQEKESKDGDHTLNQKSSRENIEFSIDLELEKWLNVEAVCNVGNR